jgi:hypothetical protein
MTITRPVLIMLAAASLPWAHALHGQERVTGVVADQRTGAPIAGVHIWGANRVSVTGPDGHFTLCRLGTGPVDLVVQRAGYYRLTPTVVLAATVPPLRLRMTRDSTWRPEPEGRYEDDGRRWRIGIVLDGQRFVHSQDGCGGSSDAPWLHPASIDPASIEAITVVKPAEAAQSYGFEGVDGAIVITTKPTPPP